MSDEELAKDLGLLSALTNGVGTTICAGIFVPPGQAAAEAGSAAALSVVAEGVISLFTALSASELGTAMPTPAEAMFLLNVWVGRLERDPVFVFARSALDGLNPR